MISSKTRGFWAFAAFLAATGACSAQQIQVQVNSNLVSFPDVQPQLIDGEVMVPVRSVFEQMGATVTWDEDTQTVTTNKDGTIAILHVGSDAATVDGQTVTLNAAPVEIGNRTMVPTRFLSEALGSKVTWNSNDNLVAIDTAATIQTPAQALHTVPVSEGEVIPISLDTELSSSGSRVGDTFTATVNPDSSEAYAELPKGARVEGHVAAVEPRQGDEPGVLDLAIDRIVFPNGKSESIEATVVSLDNQYTMVDDDGQFHATDDGSKYDRMVFVGYDGAQGVIVGTNMSGPLDQRALKATLPEIQGQLPEDSTMPSDLNLMPGTEIGIRIRHSDTIEL